MRWEKLFEDLEGQSQAAHRQVTDGEIADRARYEFGLVTLVGRCAASVGRRVAVTTAGDARIAGILSARGSDWILIEDGGVETLVATRHISTIRGLSSSAPLPAESADPAPGEDLAEVGSGLLLRHVIQGVCRDRSPVAIRLCTGELITGTLDRVARDHAELAVHPIDVARRASSVTEVAVLAMSAIAVLRAGH